MKSAVDFINEKTNNFKPVTGIILVRVLAISPMNLMQSECLTATFRALLRQKSLVTKVFWYSQKLRENLL